MGRGWVVRRLGVAGGREGRRVLQIFADLLEGGRAVGRGLGIG